MAASVSLLLGGEADTEDQGYHYTGMIVDMPVQKDLSVMGKLWLDYLTYEFEKDSDTIKAKHLPFSLPLA